MNRYALLALVALPGMLLAQPKEKQQAIAITHISVVDTNAGSARSDQTVVIVGDRIVAIGAAGDTPAPEGARVVDGTGKFLIPGLWDMHVHIAAPSYLPLFIANGVT